MPLAVAEFLFIVLWSTGFIAAEYALHDAGPFTILFWRYGLVSVILIIWAAATGALQRLHSADLRTAAATGILAHLLWLGAIFWSQHLGVPPGHTALIAALQPLLTAVLSGRVVGEPVRLQQWIGLGLGFAGVTLAVIFNAGASPNVSVTAYALPFISEVVKKSLHHKVKMGSRILGELFPE